MAKALAEDGIDATANQCDSKYRNLLATYKEKKDKRSGDAEGTHLYSPVLISISLSFKFQSTHANHRLILYCILERSEIKTFVLRIQFSHLQVLEKRANFPWFPWFQSQPSQKSLASKKTSKTNKVES